MTLADFKSVGVAASRRDGWVRLPHASATRLPLSALETADGGSRDKDSLAVSRWSDADEHALTPGIDLHYSSV